MYKVKINKIRRTHDNVTVDEITGIKAGVINE